ncbi:hypothetical protein AMELA_G00082560, partial [Ameiurus melas]
MCKKEERRTNREREGERVETSAHISITMTKTAPIAAMDYSHLWLPDIRMSKPIEVENSAADSPMENTGDSERNGSDSNNQIPSMKISPFSLSPTLSASNKAKLEECGEMSPASIQATPTQTPLSHTQLMLTGS